MQSTGTQQSLISSERVQGTTVYSPNGDEIGSIDHVMIDKQSGRVAYAVMSFGGFLGMGESHHALPWNALKYDTSLGGYRTDVTEDQLRAAPEYSESSWTDRDWERRTYDHYGVPYYWGTGSV
jgi:sporulation protein YlmC with PRC-barrel domain